MIHITGPLRNLTLSSAQKRSIFKLAIELVKADNRIHSKEISILDDLQTVLGLSQEEIDLTHYSSLQEAIKMVKMMDNDSVEVILNLFNAIMKADSDINFDESLLLSSITLSCNHESSSWAQILSVQITETEVPSRQIVYLEKKHCEAAHSVLDDRYDKLLISKAFGDIGLELFYLPDILNSMGKTLLQKSMEYLMPAGDKMKVNKLERVLEGYDICSFFKVVITRYSLDPDSFPFPSFMMLKIRDSHFLDDDNVMRPITDFLVIDLSADVKKRILEFVSMFDEQSHLLPYNGYYKFLFDDLSAESKVSSTVCIDNHFDFRLAGLGNTKIQFDSSPQARTLYLTLLRYGRAGVSQCVFEEAIQMLKEVKTSSYVSNDMFDINLFCSDLKKLDTEGSLLVYRTILVYRMLSTKDAMKESFLDYIQSILTHRSSLKTYINKGFSSINGLASPERYHIKYDKEFDTYSVDISTSLFSIEPTQGNAIELTDSSFWTSLN